MKKIILLTISLCFMTPLHADDASHCRFQTGILQKICTRLNQVWYQGKKDLYLTGYAWHNRYTYTPQTIQKNHYNELAWGGGLGKSFFDEDGDWHGLYAVAFLDSHKNVQPNVGYSFLKVKSLSPNLRLGGGYTLLVTMRPDILNGYPFPGAAPLLSLEYQRFSLVASYVPGKTNIGNVLFLVLKVNF